MTVDRDPPGGQGGTLILATEVFHGAGGIQNHTRNLVRAISQCLPAEPLSVLVLNDESGEVEVAEWHGLVARGFSRRKLAFAAGALKRAHAQQPSRVLIGHRNLIPLVPPIRLAARKAQVGLLVYGIEAWPEPKWWEKPLFKGLDRVFAISPDTARRFGGAVPVAVETWPPVLPFWWSWPDASPSRFDGTCRLLTVSRLSPTDRYKGVDATIESLTQVVGSGVNAELDIVGEGPDTERLRALARKGGVESRVRFHGRIPDERLRALYSECDLFVLPSGGEGFGIVYLEAMAHGKPVIAADAAATRFVVRPGESGFLVPYGNVPALARCIVERASDVEGSRAIGLRSREFVRSKFSFSSLLETTQRLLAQ